MWLHLDQSLRQYRMHYPQTNLRKEGEESGRSTKPIVKFRNLIDTVLSVVKQQKNKHSFTKLWSLEKWTIL